MAGIFISLEVDDKGTVKIKQFSDETKKAFDELKKGPEQTKSGLSALSEGWVGLTAKLTAATAAAYGIEKAFSSFIEQAAEAEQIENRLKFALETTGYQWQYAKSAVDDFAESIMKSTRFSDEQARQALTDMMMYTQDFSKAQMGAKLAMDMSIRTGQDLGSSSRLIGMAMSGNVEMLGRYIPELRNLDAVLGSNASMGEKAEYALKILNQKFGGTAAADVKTYAGQLAQLKNEWGELKETIGSFLIGPAEAVIKFFKGGIDLAREFFGILKSKEEFETLTRLKQDLEEAELKLRKFNEKMESINVGTPVFSFGTQQYTKEARYDLESYVNYLKSEIAVIENENKKILESKKDVFPEKENAEVAKYLEELVKHEYATWREALLEAEEQRKNREADFVNNIKGSFFNFQQAISSGWVYPTEEGEIKLKDYIELVDAASLSLAKIKVIGDEFRWDKENYFPVPGEVKGLGDKLWKEAQETQKVWEESAHSIANIWASDFSAMLDGTENFAQGVKKILLDMSNYAIDRIAKMAAEWLIFDSLTKSGSGWGTKGQTGYGGFVQFFGSLIGSLGKQEGGIFTRATPAIVGEAGPEAVVPLKHGAIPIETKGGGNMTVYVINNSSRTETTTRESGDGRGNRRVDVVISDIVSKESRRYGSPMNQSIQSMGGRNQLIRR